MHSVNPSVYILGAFLLLTVPLQWLAAAVLAAAFHECCHWAAIMILGGSVRAVSVGIHGAVLKIHLEGSGREVLAALAGPVGSLLLLHLYRGFPEIALCGLVQGLYNLLPVYPLDGGRILRCCLEHFCPEMRNRVESVCYWLLLLMCLLASVFTKWRIFALLLMVSLSLRRKRPCKARKIGVQ